jgi:glycosyltransferase involved in cell wall biosynthesis
LLPFIRREKIQIIHANTRVTQYLGYLLYKFYAIPYVCTFHGFHKPKFLRKLYKFSGVRTIAVSEAVKKHLVQDFAVGKEKIRVVYNGIDPQEFNQKTTEKTDFGYKKTDFVIGLLGRISQEKGHFLAVEAFRLLLAAHNNIYLAISGPGRLKNKLQSFVKSFQLESRVKFLDLEAKDFLSIIDLLLVPSKKEGFGYSIIEAFAKNVAVVAFNTGGIPEIIKNKENGILFYQYDAISLHSVIEELLLNQELRNRISACATRTLNNFSIEKMALATAEVYAECLK